MISEYPENVNLKLGTHVVVQVRPDASKRDWQRDENKHCAHSCRGKQIPEPEDEGGPVRQSRRVAAVDVQGDAGWAREKRLVET